MRSLKDVKKAIVKAPIHVERQADETVFKHLLRELPDSAGDLVAWRTPAGVRIAGRVVCLASVAIVVVAALWLLHARLASPSRESVPVATAAPPRIALLTEISQERAYRRGGIQAVEDQCKKALGTSTKEAAAPSLEELLAEVGGNGENTGGANL